MIEDTIIKFGNLYEELKIEAQRIVQEVKPKVLDITDATLVQSLTEKKDFYWKHDVSLLRGLANKYDLTVTKLNEILTRYIDLEKNILHYKTDFEQLGLHNITLGPKSITAYGENNIEVCIYIDIQKQELDIAIYPQDEEMTEINSNDFVNNLRDKIKTLLRENR